MVLAVNKANQAIVASMVRQASADSAALMALQDFQAIVAIVDQASAALVVGAVK